MTEQNQQQEMQSDQTSAEHPEIAEVEWYDDCFRVEEKTWGTWSLLIRMEKELLLD